MLKNNRMTTSHNLIFTQPCDSFTDILNVLTGARNNQIAFVYLNKPVSEFFRNARSGCVGKNSIVCVNLPIVNTTNAFCREILFLEAVAANKAPNFP